MAWLAYTDAKGIPVDFILDRERTAIGRHRDNDLVLPDSSVSREHAAILRREGQYILVDQNSSLGLVVNGKAAREHLLRDGDRILLGRQALCFRDPDSPADLCAPEEEEEGASGSFAWLPDLEPLRAAVQALPGGGADATLSPELLRLRRAIEDLSGDLDRTRHRHDILRALLRVSRLIHSVQDLGRLLDLVVEQAARVMGAERALLMLRDPPTGDLRSGAAFNMRPEEHAGGTISHGIARQVLQEGRGIWSKDAAADPRFCGRRSVLDLGIRSVVCAPLRRRNSAAQGVLYLDRRASDAPFSEEDLELLAGLANVVSAAIETTHVRQEEARRMRAEEDLRHALEMDRLQADFLSMISHDLRTPLTSIKSWSEILLDDWERLAPDERGRYLGIVNQECDRLTNLIDDLLDLQRLESGRFEIEARACEPEPLLRQAAETSRGAAQGKGIEMAWSCEPGLPRVLADPERIAQVFANLISNALKFTPRGGRIKLAAWAVSQSDPDAQDGRTVTDDPRALPARFVRFSVSDTGEGIPEEMQARIFERFYQVAVTRADPPKGSGLGLSICREIVERHGGAISVESRPGMGSTFSFLLPCAPPGA